MRTVKLAIAASLAAPFARRAPLIAKSHANGHKGEICVIKEWTSTDPRTSGGSTPTQTRTNAT
jgi:hypothetical protein